MQRSRSKEEESQGKGAKNKGEEGGEEEKEGRIEGEETQERKRESGRTKHYKKRNIQLLTGNRGKRDGEKGLADIFGQYSARGAWPGR